MRARSSRGRLSAALALVVVPLTVVLALPQASGADSPPAATALGAAPAPAVLSGTSWTATLSAELTSVATNQGVPNQTITFTVGSGSDAVSCSAVTGGSSGGHASCPVSYSILQDPTSYAASFTGSDDYAASSATASLTEDATAPTGPGAPDPAGGLVALLQSLLALLASL